MRKVELLPIRDGEAGYGPVGLPLPHPIISMQLLCTFYYSLVGCPPFNHSPNATCNEFSNLHTTIIPFMTFVKPTAINSSHIKISYVILHSILYICFIMSDTERGGERGPGQRIAAFKCFLSFFIVLFPFVFIFVFVCFVFVFIFLFVLFVFVFSSFKFFYLSFLFPFVFVCLFVFSFCMFCFVF